MSEIFGYIIAYRYDEGKRFSTYTYGNTVFHGSTDDAKSMLEYVRQKSPKENWAIYKIENEPLKENWYG